MEAYNGIDFSFARVTPAAISSPDVQMYNQSLWTGNQQPENRVVNLRDIDNAGKRISGSIAVVPGQTGMQSVASGRAGVPDDLWAKLEFVSIDAEVAGISTQQIVDAHDALKGLGKPIRVVYTRRMFWNTMPNMNDARLQGSLLWDSRPAAATFIPFTPYGVWTVESNQVLGVQTQIDGTLFSGMAVDIDHFNLNLVSDGLVILRQAWEDDTADSIEGAVSLHEGPINPMAVALFAVRQQQKATAWDKLVNPGSGK